MSGQGGHQDWGPGQPWEPRSQLRGRVLGDSVFPFGQTKGQTHGGQSRQGGEQAQEQSGWQSPVSWREELEPTSHNRGRWISSSGHEEGPSTSGLQQRCFRAIFSAPSCFFTNSAGLALTRPLAVCPRPGLAAHSPS